MDPFVAAAAARVVGWLAPIASKKVDELGTKLGERAVARLQAYWESFKRRRASDPETTATVAQFEADPVGQKEAMTATLTRCIREEPAMSTELEALAEEVGPTVVVVMIGGAVSVQEGPAFGDVLHGRVQVGQRLGTGERQIGPRFGDIG